jgi:hypothetical protein
MACLPPRVRYKHVEILPYSFFYEAIAPNTNGSGSHVEQELTALPGLIKGTN